MQYANGGGTEFPICLYWSHREPKNLKDLGKPCNAAASDTVIRLTKDGTLSSERDCPAIAIAWVFSIQFSADEFLSKRVSINGVLFPPMEAGKVWHGRSRSIGRPRPLKSIPAYAEERSTGFLVKRNCNHIQSVQNRHLFILHL